MTEPPDFRPDERRQGLAVSEEIERCVKDARKRERARCAALVLHHLDVTSETSIAGKLLAAIRSGEAAP